MKYDLNVSIKKLEEETNSNVLSSEEKVLVWHFAYSACYINECVTLIT